MRNYKLQNICEPRCEQSHALAHTDNEGTPVLLALMNANIFTSDSPSFYSGVKVRTLRWRWLKYHCGVVVSAYKTRGRWSEEAPAGNISLFIQTTKCILKHSLLVTWFAMNQINKAVTQFRPLMCSTGLDELLKLLIMKQVGSQSV